MPFRKGLWAAAVVLCLAAPMAVQAQEDYLDVFIVKVKPEKVTEFNALNKKWVDANRRFNGDHWLAMETLYGEGNVYQFTSFRKDYADVATTEQATMLAANKAFGKAAADKIGQDFMNCLVWSRTELRRRRMDLSRKPPADADSYAKLVGQSRFLRTTAVHIRSGHVPEFEDLLKEVKEAGERNPDMPPLLVSQAVEGAKGATFYVTSLRSSMSGFDHNPTMREILGDEGFKKFQKVSADAVETSESALYRFAPDISNPPDDIAKVASDFWHPKTTNAMAAARTKSKTATMEPATAKEPVKQP
ncbi:MAG TPA: hypothetical protein VMR90_13410 [Candidatus Cybelea sp.]|nr:hypothetical protein [Candidatus Cybelea sp.]